MCCATAHADSKKVTHSDALALTYNAQRLQRECEILVEVGLVVRCDQCTNSGVLVFNELCESCRVEVEGQARACINGALS